MVASSGSPFNITSPNDLNGDSVFNDRPGLLTRATCSTVVPPPSSNVYCTPLGTFDARPDLASIPEGALPINYGTGPAHFALNLRLTKTFGFGPKAPNKATPSGGAIEGGRAGGGGGGHGHGPLFGGGAMGGMPSASDRRYSLTLGVSARNVLNKVNLANPSGILGSTFFDLPNALQGGPFSSGSANRRIDLQATFAF